ncbi:MAG TPA: hypothetical protein DDY68_06075, partial [Porphyromonadaceae bacterium]|nr:hypothetical protein [Porphyromonadaceae bacterium]
LEGHFCACTGIFQRVIQGLLLRDFKKFFKGAFCTLQWREFTQERKRKILSYGLSEPLEKEFKSDFILQKGRKL